MLVLYSKWLYVANIAIIATGLFISLVPGFEGVGAWLTPPFVLFLGLLFALLCGQPFPAFNKNMSKMLLQYSIVGLGFGMNLQASLASGSEGMIFTIVSVFGTLAIGWLIGRKLLGVDRNTSYLISSGTAICGGSAIAAVAPVLKAKDNDTVVTGRIGGTPVRILKNRMAREYVKREKEGADKMELENFTLGSLRRAVFDGDTETGSLMAGQVSGQLKEIRSLAEIFEDMFDGAKKTYEQLNVEF